MGYRQFTEKLTFEPSKRLNLRTTMSPIINASVLPNSATGHVQATVQFLAMDTLPDLLQIQLGFSAPVHTHDDAPTGFLTFWLQHGLIRAKVDQSTQRPRCVGRFRPAELTEITVLLQVRPNTPLFIEVRNGATPGICTTFRTAKQPFAPHCTPTLLAWTCEPPQRFEASPAANRRAVEAQYAHAVS